jgi:putative salt-induced outer membrane protein YdiY
MRDAIRLSGAAAVLLAALTTFGQDVKPAFAHTFSLGATMTDGNSDSRQGNATWLTEGAKEGLGAIRLGAEGNYGESRPTGGQMDKTIENAKASVNVKKTLSAMTFTYVDASYLYDDIALIDYRITVGPGLGVYMVKNDTTQFSVEAGPSYVFERVDGQTDSHPALRVAERLEHKLSATARIWEAVEVLSDTEKFSDYLVNSELGVEAALNSTLNLRLVLQNKFDSQPAADTEKSDTTFIAGVSVKL